MLTLNIDIDDRLVNVLVGRVKKFRSLNNEVSVLCVKFNDDSAELVARQLDVTAWQHHRVPIKKREELFGSRKNRKQPSVKRTQFPLTLPWTCTVHKIQGLTLAEGVGVSEGFTLESQKSFNQGQMFVALSKITSISELYLIRKYSKAGLK